MKSASKSFAVVILALAASGAALAAEPETPVDVAVEGLQPRVAAEVRKHAAQGMTALNRYLVRTQKQHGLALEDVVKKPAAQAAADGPMAPKEYRRYATDWR